MSTDRDKILTAAANGNAAALEFLRAFARRAHWVDDIADEPVKATVPALAAHESEWLLVLSGNAFFSAHRAQLVPAMVLALNAWADSYAMAPGTVSDVVKGQWHEVVWLVAWLTGGWNSLRSITAEFRVYDIEVKPAKPPSCGKCARCDQPITSEGPYRTHRDPLAMFCSLACIHETFPESKELNGLPR